MWDDELEGKEGFYADDIASLKSFVNVGASVSTVEKSKYNDIPFLVRKDTWCRFFYYDPNYAVKRAYLEGKQIQVFNFVIEKWEDIGITEKDIAVLSWFDKDWKLRIKPSAEEV